VASSTAGSTGWSDDAGTAICSAKAPNSVDPIPDHPRRCRRRRSHRPDDAGELTAHRERHGDVDLVLIGHQQDVGEVDGGGRHLHHHCLRTHRSGTSTTTTDDGGRTGGSGRRARVDLGVADDVLEVAGQFWRASSRLAGGGPWATTRGRVGSPSGPRGPRSPVDLGRSVHHAHDRASSTCRRTAFRWTHPTRHGRAWTATRRRARPWESGP